MGNYKVWDKVVRNTRWYEKGLWNLDFEIINSISVSWEDIYNINWNPIEMYRKVTKEEKKLYFN